SRTNSRELDRLEEEGIDFMRKVRNAYIEISQKHSERFATIDGSKDIDQTAGSIEVVLTEFLARRNESGGS
ncbi:MAG: dTMP kinase, partial [bacterium]